MQNNLSLEKTGLVERLSDETHLHDVTKENLKAVTTQLEKAEQERAGAEIMAKQWSSLARAQEVSDNPLSTILYTNYEHR